MGFVVIVLLLGGLLLFTTLSPPSRSPIEESREAAWRAFAASRGVAFTPGDGRASGTQGTLEGTDADVVYRVVLAIHSGYDGEGSFPSTLVSAAAAAPLAVSVGARPQSGLSRLAVTFGAEDFILGDAPFDERFVVNGSSEEAAKEMLDAPTRRALLALPPSASFGYDRGRVSLSWEGLETSPAVLAAACDLIVAVCRQRRDASAYR